LGAIIGLIAYFTVPNIVIAENVFIALIVGGASGLAATGTNQVFKQLSKKIETNQTNIGTDNTNNKVESNNNKTDANKKD
jgi:hypothetical protein